MDNLYFNQVAGIGNLYLEHVFYEFETEPILFSCVDEERNLYFCLCSEIRYGQKWMIMRCSIAMLRALIDEKTELLSAFLSVPQLAVVLMDRQGNESSSIIDSDRADRLDLPKEKTFLKCDKDSANNYLWMKEWENSWPRQKAAWKTEADIDFFTDTFTVNIQKKDEWMYSQLALYQCLHSKALSASWGTPDQTIEPAGPQKQNYTIYKKANITEQNNVEHLISDDWLYAA